MAKTVSTLMLAMLVICSASAQQKPSPKSTVIVPRLIRFGGVLRSTEGKPLSATAGVTFALYKDQSGGAALWQETQNVPMDASGRYNVLLGATKSDGVPIELFTTGEAQWLGIRVEGQEEQPRVLLVSVPYALKAQEAETLAGKPASQFVSTETLKEQVRQEVKAQVQPNARTKSNTKSSAAGAAAVASGPTNFSGATADQIVGVTQTGTGNGVVSKTPGAAGIGVYGLNTSTAAGVGYGVRGDSSTVSGRGMRGLASGSSGVGVQATATGAGGIGLLGESKATAGSNIGLYGTNASPVGIAGVFNNTAGGKILSLRSNGVEKVGVLGNGNVGIGTTTPKHRLGLAGGPAWTTNGWLGSVELPNGSALGWQTNDATMRFGMGHTNGGFLIFRTTADPGTTGSQAIYDFGISDAGNVQIGGNFVFPNSNRLQVESPGDAVHGISTLNGRGVWGESLQFQGVYGFSELNAGIVGESHKFHAVYGVSHDVNNGGVYGTNDANGFGVIGVSADGTGVKGDSANGFAMSAAGNVTQNRDKGGWVKAMAYVGSGGGIFRCFNSFIAGSAASAPPCGFTATSSTNGVFRVNFGFPVNDRFISLTPHYGPGNAAPNNMGANFVFPDADVNAVDVVTYDANDGDDSYGVSFMIFVY
ncbi:MAG TPA: hypothetical protein VFA76_10820 [Terriglobales bacterium]|nr:hypothetical protein [Terriglobales bacterium]